ncbi:MAG: 6-phosphofructokinase, partial [Eubacterium sp.]|nr:6-phosphofructokinase [Eubacterium sp.]
IMGNKAGWLTLYAGIAGGADIVLIPEIPYKTKKVVEAVKARAEAGKSFSIIAVAEGAMSAEEAEMKKKERMKLRAEAGYTTVTSRIAREIQEATGLETRTVVPGHMLRGGSPSAYDRVLATRFGVRAAQLIKDGKFGYTVAQIGSAVTENKLSDVAMKTKFVPADDKLVVAGKDIGVSFGD